MAAAIALAFSQPYADDTTKARQEAQEQKAEAQKEASEAKTEAQRDMSEAKADAQKDMSEAEKKAHEKSTEADREAREKTAEANKEMREETTEAQKDMAEEGREVRASDDRAGAMGTGSAGDADKAPLSKTARDTLQKLHASSQMEVGMARIAKDKAQNDKVKDLAEKIQDDHTDMQDKISELARERNVDLAAHDQMSKNRKHVEQMEKMQGAAFDKHYADMMAKEHKKDIAELRKAQTQLRANKSDEKVAELVDDALPKLEEHQKMALEAQSELRGTQRQGRRGSTTGATAPSSTDANDTRTGAAKSSDQMGNDARPRDAVHGTENKEGTPTGSTTSDGSSDKKY
jgi:putative membrane protein